MAANTPNSDDFESNDSDFSSINIVPFVDIVLVLLVIFMVTAPMLAKQTLDLNLPKATSADPRDEEVIGVVLLKTEQALINGEPTEIQTAREAIEQKAKNNPNIQAILSADTSVSHGKVVEWIDLIRQAGVKRFALEVERKK